MPAASLPANESSRLEALEQAAILGTAPEDAFDAIAREAARSADTPIALVTFVSEDKQWFKATVGLDIAETDRDSAFCAWAIHSEEVLWVEDAECDERFSDNPLVHGDPNIRAYAGAPIATPEGYLLGTLCVIDRVPRPYDPAVAETLKRLSTEVSRALEQRRPSCERIRRAERR